MRRLLFILIFFSFVAFQLPSASASIINLSINRHLGVHVDTTNSTADSDFIDNTTTGNWDHQLQKDLTDPVTGDWVQATASQNSLVNLNNSLVISGSLSASVNYTGDTSNLDGSANAYILVGFTVTNTPAPYNYGMNGIGDMLVTLYDSNSVSYGSSGILNPGDYQLYAYVAAGGLSASNMSSANLSFTAVPIPSALWLLGSGLIGFVGIKRWFRR